MAAGSRLWRRGYCPCALGGHGTAKDDQAKRPALLKCLFWFTITDKKKRKKKRRPRIGQKTVVKEFSIFLLVRVYRVMMPNCGEVKAFGPGEALSVGIMLLQFLR